MTPDAYHGLIDETESMAMTAREYVPRGSFYYRWMQRVIAQEELPVLYFPKLYKRLLTFHNQ